MRRESDAGKRGWRNGLEMKKDEKVAKFEEGNNRVDQHTNKHTQQE